MSTDYVHNYVYQIQLECNDSYVYYGPIYFWRETSGIAWLLLRE